MVVTLLCAVAIGCDSTDKMRAPISDTLNSVSARQWQLLGKRSIYFGPQSVGDNIMSGVRGLNASHPELQLNILSGASTSGTPAFYEFKIGKNGDTRSKNEAFLSTTDGELGPKPVLMFKYCYVDVTEKTDVEAVFREYQETLTALHARHPEAIVVHTTIPLTVAESQGRYYLNHLRGLPTVRALNSKRTRYNLLLREAFAGREPIFDLGRMESIHNNGREEIARHEGMPAFALAPEWSSDGGHLNLDGSKRAAEQLLITLASLTDR
jgi:hypothetical protein